jgi:hypothetical protein
MENRNAGGRLRRKHHGISVLELGTPLSWLRPAETRRSHSARYSANSHLLSPGGPIHLDGRCLGLCRQIRRAVNVAGWERRIVRARRRDEVRVAMQDAGGRGLEEEVEGSEGYWVRKVASAHEDLAATTAVLRSASVSGRASGEGAHLTRITLVLKAIQTPITSHGGNGESLGCPGDVGGELRFAASPSAYFEAGARSPPLGSSWM